MDVPFGGADGYFVLSILPSIFSSTVLFRYLHVKNSLWRNAFNLYVGMLVYLALLGVMFGLNEVVSDFFDLLSFIFLFVVFGHIFGLPFLFLSVVFNSMFSSYIYRD